MTKSALICVVVILGLVTLASRPAGLAGNLRQDERQDHHPEVLRAVHGRPQDLRRRGAVQPGLARRSRSRRVPHGCRSRSPGSRRSQGRLHALRAARSPRSGSSSSASRRARRLRAYNPKMDLGRVPMDMKKAGAPIENLKMTLTSLGSVAGKLEMAWENTIASVPFNLDAVKANREW